MRAARRPRARSCGRSGTRGTGRGPPRHGTLFEQDRTVYAVPGPIGVNTSEGCNLLIRNQVAKIYYSGVDVMKDMDVNLNFNSDSIPSLDPQKVERTGSVTKPNLPMKKTIIKKEHKLKRLHSKLVLEPALVGNAETKFSNFTGELIYNNGETVPSSKIHHTMLNESQGNYRSISICNSLPFPHQQPSGYSIEHLYDSGLNGKNTKHKIRKKNSSFLEELDSLLEGEMTNGIAVRPGNCLIASG